MAESSSVAPERLTDDDKLYSYLQKRFAQFEYLGSGAVGQVYRTFDTVLQRSVALKVVSRSALSSNPRMQASLTRLARLQHPNIVQLLDLIEGESETGIVLSYCNGQRLDSYVRESDIGISEKVSLFLQVASAIAYLHRSNLLYCDLKPENVVLDGGSPVIVDFDLLTSLDEWSDGRTAGTPYYMAPEVARGGAASVASEVYALGVLLGFLLTADDATSQSTWLNEKYFAPTTPLKRSAAYRDWSAILAKATHENAKLRYASVDELFHDVSAVAAGHSIKIRKPGPVEMTAKWVKQHPVTAVILSALVLVLLGGGAASLYATRLLQKARLKSQENERAVESNIELTLAAKIRLTSLIADSNKALEDALALEARSKSQRQLVQQANKDLLVAVEEAERLRLQSQQALEQLRKSQQEVADATKARETAGTTASREKRRLATVEYARICSEAWKAMDDGEWSSAQALLARADDKMKGFEFGLLESRLNAQSQPVEVRLASSQAIKAARDAMRFPQRLQDQDARKLNVIKLWQADLLEKLSRKPSSDGVVAVYRWEWQPLLTMTTNEITRNISYQEGVEIGEDDFGTHLLRLGPAANKKIIALARDGSVLYLTGAEHGNGVYDRSAGDLCIWTFRPDLWPAEAINEQNRLRWLEAYKTQMLVDLNPEMINLDVMVSNRNRLPPVEYQYANTIRDASRIAETERKQKRSAHVVVGRLRATTSTLATIGDVTSNFKRLSDNRIVGLIADPTKPFFIRAVGFKEKEVTISSEALAAASNGLIDIGDVELEKLDAPRTTGIQACLEWKWACDLPLPTQSLHNELILQGIETRNSVKGWKGDTFRRELHFSDEGSCQLAGLPFGEYLIQRASESQTSQLTIRDVTFQVSPNEPNVRVAVPVEPQISARVKWAVAQNSNFALDRTNDGVLSPDGRWLQTASQPSASSPSLGCVQKGGKLFLQVPQDALSAALGKGTLADFAKTVTGDAKAESNKRLELKQGHVYLARHRQGKWMALIEVTQMLNPPPPAAKANAEPSPPSPEKPKSDAEYIKEYEARLAALPAGKFDWHLHNALRHHYRKIDKTKSMQHADTILSKSVLDKYMRTCLTWPLKDDKKIIERLKSHISLYPEFVHLTAACSIWIAELEKAPEARLKLYTDGLSRPNFPERYKQEIEKRIKQVQAELTPPKAD